MNAGSLAAPGARWVSGALALGVHLLFAVLLFFGLTWQVHEPAPVMVELWQSLPRPEAQPTPAPVKPTPPAPAPVAKPPPEPALQRDAEIAYEIKRERERREHQARMQALQREQAEAERREREAERQRLEKIQLQEKTERKKEQDRKQALARAFADDEQAMLDAEAQKLEALHRDAAERAQASSGVVNDYRGRISQKVRGNTRLPENLVGNPEVRYRVRLLPTGEVVSVKRVKSSGNDLYDQAVARAIEKSSPLPLPPERGARAAFVPELNLIHRPKD